ncbi:hypothetical protein Barb6_02335 [Bacteroidales bacterium Barb6]|nr:hypothetical protein Barb6_02335 [Bacteroidales bacterium Barb6]
MDETSPRFFKSLHTDCCNLFLIFQIIRYEVNHIIYILFFSTIDIITSPSPLPFQNTPAFKCSPVLSSSPNIKFILCTACPLASFSKLSISDESNNSCRCGERIKQFVRSKAAILNCKNSGKAKIK